MGHSGPVLVDVAIVREAFERSGLSKSELARRLGWFQPQPWRVSRALGYSVDTNSRGVRATPRQHIHLAQAYKLIEAMGLDPADFDFNFFDGDD